jgi:hypothetical protein
MFARRVTDLLCNDARVAADSRIFLGEIAIAFDGEGPASPLRGSSSVPAVRAANMIIAGYFKVSSLLSSSGSIHFIQMRSKEQGLSRRETISGGESKGCGGLSSGLARTRPSRMGRNSLTIRTMRGKWVGPWNWTSNRALRTQGKSFSADQARNPVSVFPDRTDEEARLSAGDSIYTIDWPVKKKEIPVHPELPG